MILAGLALMACTPSEPATTTTTETTTTTTPPVETPAPAPTDPAADTCNMAQYAALIGKPATDAAVPPASATVRHITPTTQVTMDFVATRLNVDISAEGVVTGVRCG
ncbi:MAG: I78 family peptidase inhibitor [Hyphomonadaceae bacterium]|nr:I78 family peptidase inhibitor [Hyphomonadaceae bacterium]